MENRLILNKSVAVYTKLFSLTDTYQWPSILELVAIGKNQRDMLFGVNLALGLQMALSERFFM